jgi:8-oxo-dGTP pyrophosphatase MutT (NUDIX family)
VSDWGPAEEVAGKIPSNAEELVLRLRRLPKVLDTWRDAFGPEATIVGFKLLSRADTDDDGLVRTATAQNARARLDATVANFAEDITGPEHPIRWVTPGDEPMTIDGSRAEVAEGIVSCTTLGAAIRRATTLCLWCRATDRVLLLRRSARGTFASLWAHVGGARDPGDADDYAAGIREAREEAGLDLAGMPRPDERGRCVRFVGWSDPADATRVRGWRLTNYVVEVPAEIAPVPDGAEIVEARWVDRAEAGALPMGPATRAALRKVWPGFSGA